MIIIRKKKRLFEADEQANVQAQQPAAQQQNAAPAAQTQPAQQQPTTQNQPANNEQPAQANEAPGAAVQTEVLGFIANINNELKKFCSEGNIVQQIPSIKKAIDLKTECPVANEVGAIVNAVRSMAGVEVKADDPETMKKCMEAFNQVIISLNAFSKASVEKWQAAPQQPAQQNAAPAAQPAQAQPNTQPAQQPTQTVQQNAAPAAQPEAAQPAQ